jgi:hypothetical protein
MVCPAGSDPDAMRVKLVLNGPSNSCKFRADVVKFVAAKASRNLKNPQVPGDGVQTIPSKALKIAHFQ